MRQRLNAVLIGKPERVDWSALTAQDWQRFVQAAHAHSVAPLLWYTLEDIGWPDAIPPEVRRALHRAFYQTTAHNMLLYQELAHVLDALQGIPVVVLKGAALATTLYPHMGTRPMVDIDLLVPRSAMPESLQALRRLHYSEPVPEIISGFNLTHRYHVCLQKHVAHASVLVEVHWHLIGGEDDQRAPPIHWFWQQCAPWFLPPRQPDAAATPHTGDAYQLTPLAHLLYLVAHLVLQHGSTQQRLLWYYDLHLLLTYYADILDWGALIENASRFGWDAALDSALKSTWQQYETVLPAQVQQRIAGVPPADRPDVPVPAASASSRARLLREELAYLTWRGRCHLVRAHLLPSPGYLRWRYRPQPAWLWPLCYPYRWLDMAGTTLRAVAQSIWNTNETRREDETP